MKVRWVKATKSGKWKVYTADFDSQFDLALVEFVNHNQDPNVEAVELIEDKGEDAPARNGRWIKTLEEIADWMNEQEED